MKWTQFHIVVPVMENQEISYSVHLLNGSIPRVETFLNVTHWISSGNILKLILLDDNEYYYPGQVIASRYIAGPKQYKYLI